MQSDEASTPNTPPPKLSYAWFVVIFIALVVLVNFTMLAVAAYDRYYLAFGIAMLFGPAVNIFIGLVGLFAWRLFRRREHFPSAVHLTMTLGLPLVATLFNAAIILLAGLDNGC